MRISLNAEAGCTFSGSTLELVHGIFKNVSGKQARIKLKIKFLEEILYCNEKWWLEKKLQGYVICAGYIQLWAEPRGRAVWDVGLRPLACWDYGLESRLGIDGLLFWVLCVR